MNPIGKLLLVKEILSKEGKVHFRRFRLAETPWFNLYLHEIRRSDEDRHMHDHPWHFKSLILWGKYMERTSLYPKFDSLVFEQFQPGDVVHHHASDVHKITLKSPVVWTLVLTSGRKRMWGYRTAKGWIDFKTYRQLKRDGQLPE
jgi:hypothetical protein